MNRRVCLGTLAGLALIPASRAASPESTDGPASRELRQIIKADQDDRKNWAAHTPSEREAVEGRDAARFARVQALLHENKLITGEDYDNAALVFQHGQTADDALVAHELSLIAAMKGAFSNLPALAEDRFLLRVGRKQRFGAQGTADGKSIQPTDEDGPTAVTDALRADMFVPPLAASKKNGPAALMTATNALMARQKERRDPKWLAQAAKRSESAELKRLATLRQHRAPKTSDLWTRVLELYRADALATPDDYYYAAIVIGDRYSAETLLLAHELAVVAAMRGHKEAPALAARKLDYFLVHISQPQRYGTVILPRADGAREPGRIENVAASVTDAIRVQLGVPSLAARQKEAASRSGPPVASF